MATPNGAQCVLRLPPPPQLPLPCPCSPCSRVPPSPTRQSDATGACPQNPLGGGAGGAVTTRSVPAAGGQGRAWQPGAHFRHSIPLTGSRDFFKKFGDPRRIPRGGGFGPGGGFSPCFRHEVFRGKVPTWDLSFKRLSQRRPTTRRRCLCGPDARLNV